MEHKALGALSSQAKPIQLEWTVPALVSTGQIHVLNTLLAASAEGKLGEKFLQVSTSPFRLPWAAMGLPALQDMDNSNSPLGLRAERPGDPQTRAKDRSLEQEEILLLANEPLSPFPAPQQAGARTGGRAHRPLGCSSNRWSRAWHTGTQPTGQTLGGRSTAA